MRAQVALATVWIIAGCANAAENPASTGGAANSGGQQQSSGGNTTAGSNTAAGTSGSTAVGGQVGVGGNATAGTVSSGGQPDTAGAGGAVSVAGTSGSGGSGGGAGGSGGVAGSGGSGGGGNGGAVKSAGCDKARTLMDGNQPKMMSAGQSRDWYVKAPKGYDQSHPYRTIFMYHWNYGSINAIVNPPDADHNTDRPFYGIEDLSGDSTIFVVPNGLENGWANTGGRDSTFTDDMYKAVTEGLCIDTTRVFTTGFSYGGAMSIKLACTMPDKFRAAIIYDTGTILSGFNEAECKTPIAYFGSHGLDDQTFKYADQGLKVLGIFTKLDGCTAQTPPMAADNAHTCVSFDGCSAGHPVRFCNFGKGENNPKAGGPGGHYPSPKDPGQTTSWVPAEAWKFISQF